MKNLISIFMVNFVLISLLFFGVVYAQEDKRYPTVEEALDNIEEKIVSGTKDKDAEIAPLEKTEADDIDQGDAPEEENVATEDESLAKETTVEISQEVKKERILVDVLELKNMSIDDVLKLISKKTGLNIVKGKNVSGKITIYLKNVDVRDALRIILESNDLAFSEEEGIIRVMTAKDYELAYGYKFGDKTEIKIVQLKYATASDTVALLAQVKSIVGKVIADEKSNTLVLIDIPNKLKLMGELVSEIDVPVETKVFNLSYAKAEEIANKVGEALTKNVGNVKFDDRSNRIIVTDTPRKLENIKKIIDAFDVKHKEVSIEAKIVQVTLSDQYKMGVDWQSIVSNYHALTLTSDFDKLSSSDKKGSLSIGTISSDDYTVLIEALDTVGTTNILSSPSITVINNEEAKILVGSTQPYVTTTTTTPATGATTTAESVNFIDVGVKLFVTPTIHNDGYITMKIKPEVSSVIGKVTTSNNNEIPVVETAEAETTIMVKDRITIVIGGLIKDEKVEIVSKVPFLGDIPFLGMAFRNKDKLLRKTEIIIFLTPQIVTGDSNFGGFLSTF